MSITYYRGPDVVITGELFVVWTPHPQTFKIQELDEVYVVRTAAHPVKYVLGIVSVAALVGVVALWPWIDNPAAYAAAAALIVMPPVIAGVHGRLSRGGHELRAVYHGAEITLFSSTDLTTFGQVRRGLMRVLEGRQQAGGKIVATTYGHE